MKIALISDIHSNYIALCSVIEDIERQGIEQIFCLGELMGEISFDWTLKHTSKENKEWMKDLPKEIRLNINGEKLQRERRRME